MKFVAKSQAQKFKNGPSCVVYEYPFGDKDINGASGVINDRYPEQGWVMNEVCKELVYAVKGAGTLHIDGAKQRLEPGDMALIEPGERYYFKGNGLTVLMFCSPAWYPEQHKEVDD